MGENENLGAKSFLRNNFNSNSVGKKIMDKLDEEFESYWNDFTITEIPFNKKAFSRVMLRTGHSTATIDKYWAYACQPGVEIVKTKSNGDTVIDLDVLFETDRFYIDKDTNKKMRLDEPRSHRLWFPEIKA